MTSVCVGLAVSMQVLREYRESQPRPFLEQEVYVTDIQLPLMPGPMCTVDSEENMDPEFVASF